MYKRMYANEIDCWEQTVVNRQLITDLTLKLNVNIEKLTAKIDNQVI